MEKCSLPAKPLSLSTINPEPSTKLTSVIGLAPIWLPKPCKSGAHERRSLREKQWPDLKGRLRELLCIHGLTKLKMKNTKCRIPETERRFILHSAFRTLHFELAPRLVSRQRLLVFSEALIYL